LAQLFVAIGATGVPQTVAGVKRAADSLNDLNRMRREGIRWQRLAGYTDAGALDTLARLQTIYGRVIGRSEGFNKALEMQVKRQVVGIATAGGYSKAQRDWLYTLTRIDVSFKSQPPMKNLSLAGRTMLASQHGLAVRTKPTNTSTIFTREIL
jgi:hypothetical protein